MTPEAGTCLVNNSHSLYALVCTRKDISGPLGYKLGCISCLLGYHALWVYFWKAFCKCAPGSGCQYGISDCVPPGICWPGPDRSMRRAYGKYSQKYGAGMRESGPVHAESVCGISSPCFPETGSEPVHEKSVCRISSPVPHRLILL